MNFRQIVVLLATIAASCTSVQANLETGIVRVDTFATSRQDIDIGRNPDGSVWWRAKNSSPDQTLAAAVLELSKLVTAVPKP